MYLTCDSKCIEDDHLQKLTVQQLRRSHKKGAKEELKRRLDEQNCLYTSLTNYTNLQDFLLNSLNANILEFLKQKNIILNENEMKHNLRINLKLIPIKLTLEEEDYFTKSSLLFLFQNGIIQDSLSIPPPFLVTFYKN